MLMLYEFRTLFLSPVAYIVGFAFSLLMVLIFLFLLDDYSRFSQPCHLMVLFFKSMWLPTVFFLPVITMRSVALERDNGMLDTFILLPIRRIWIVLSKFFVTYFYYMILWLGVYLFPFIAGCISKELTLSLQITDSVIVNGGMFFIFCSSTLFISLGIFISSIVPSQLASSVASFVVLFFILIAGQMLQYAAVQNYFDGMHLQSVTDIMDVFMQIEDFCNGIIDTRVIMFYITAACLCLFATAITIERH
jgi:ABC-2 type transport system permease protein